MENLQTIWGFVLLGSVLVFPQLLGVLLFFLLKGRPHFLAHAFSFVAPFLLSIFFVWLIYMYRYYQANPDERCGGPMLGAMMMLLFSGCLQLVMGACAQVALHSRSAICGRRYSAVR